jgi:hypothetical protein
MQQQRVVDVGVASDVAAVTLRPLGGPHQRPTTSRLRGSSGAGANLTNHFRP